MEKEKKKPGRPSVAPAPRGKAKGAAAPAPRREAGGKSPRKESSRPAAEGKKRSAAASVEAKTAEKKTTEAKRRSPRAARTEAAPRHRLKVALLGGLLEIGKNMCLLEYGRDIIIVDAGIAFPDEEMPGVDLVIPDITYLTENRDRVRGILRLGSLVHYRKYSLSARQSRENRRGLLRDIVDRHAELL